MTSTIYKLEVNHVSSSLNKSYVKASLDLEINRHSFVWRKDKIDTSTFNVQGKTLYTPHQHKKKLKIKNKGASLCCQRQLNNESMNTTSADTMLCGYQHFPTHMGAP